MLSRRELLIGATAATVVGVGGLVEAGANRRRHLLHRIGLAPSPDHHVPPSGARLLSGTLSSSFMRRPVGWTLSVPAAAATGVVYCLHGKGDNHRFAFDTIHVHDVAAAQGANVSIAAVDGGGDSYWHPRADGTDSLSMLLQEFIPMVDRRLGVTSRALMGWSMGGYGALLAAETAPEQFRAVAVASPALWRSAGATAPGAFDGPDDYRRHDVFAGVARLAGLTVRVDCGRGDPFLAADRAFVGQLPAPAQGSFGAGYHEPSYWRSVAPAQISTIVEAVRGH
jgi:S-formylglutathione hydrolase FrmB